MAPNPTFSTPYNPSLESSAPALTLPEHMHGLIDLATLADMNRFLKESKSVDDLILAGWIQDNFLYEPMDQTTRPIRTPEGFAKLDNAYRRVRSLTNKVQDKWPFYDQNFKLMSTATVRNNSRGEISPGVMFKPEGSAFLASGVTTIASPTLELQLPFTHQQVRVFSQRKEPAQSSEHALAPLRQKLLTPPKLSPEKDTETANVTASQSGELTPADSTVFDGFPERAGGLSDAKGFSSPVAKLALGEYQGFNEEVPISAHSQADSQCGQQSSHVRELRGKNGRFQPKASSSPASKKTEQRLVSKASNHLDLNESGSEMPKSPVSEPTNGSDPVPDLLQSFTPLATGSLESTEAADLPLPNLSSAGHEEDIVGPSVEASKPRVRFNDVMSEGSTPVYALAVESDPVVSNLDRLPPNSLKRVTKRKSPPSSQSSPRPAKRGRPSNLKKAPANTEMAVPDGLDVAQSATPTDHPEKIGVTTRRSARRSAAADAEISAAQLTIATAHATPEKTEVPEETEAPMELEPLMFPDESYTIVESDAQSRTSVEQKATPVPPFKVKKTRSKADPRVTSPRATRSKTSAPDLKVEEQSSSASATDDLLDLAMSHMAKADSVTLQSGPTPAKGKKSRFKKSASPHISAPQANANGATDMPEIRTSASATHTAKKTSSIDRDMARVEYFARITTANGTLDVPMSANVVKSEEEQLLKKYAVFVSKNGSTKLDLETYREIYFEAKR